MDTTSYDVRIWKTEVYSGKRKTTHSVRWTVAGRAWRDAFGTAALAESFRSELLSAARRGVAFDTTTGRPKVQEHEREEQSWYEFACAYADMKWPDSAGKSRAGIADTLATLTPAFAKDRPAGKAPANLRLALYAWAFNSRARMSGPVPAHLRSAIRWAERNTIMVSALEDATVVRRAISAIGKKKDGSPAATSTISRKRAVFFNALEFAIERRLLDKNPLVGTKRKHVQRSEAIDRRVVINRDQADRLLTAVEQQGKTAHALVAFFALMYYAALRPAEAAGLTHDALRLPESGEGWGEIFLSGSAPTTGAAWSENGRRRDDRSLKHRAKEEVRMVPCAPPLVTILRSHLATFGTRSSGRLFAGVRGGDLSESLYGAVWQKARTAALTKAEAVSPLAKRPYDLRHAAVSTWLNAGVPAVQVAEWAGHSLAVLLRVYAKCIVGQEDAALERIAAALGDTTGSSARIQREPP